MLVAGLVEFNLLAQFMRVELAAVEIQMQMVEQILAVVAVVEQVQVVNAQVKMAVQE